MKHPRWLWPQEALTGSLQLLRRYRDVQKLMIPGNHDGDVSMVGGSGLAPFADVARVVEEPEVVDGLLCVPAGHHDRLETRHFAEAKAVVAHAFLSGVALGPEEVKLERELTPRMFGCGPELGLPGFFGDIHKGQALRVRRPKPPAWEPYVTVEGLGHAEPGHGAPVRLRNPAPWCGEVFYPGSPYPQNWGERNDGVKGVLLVELGTGQVDFHPVRAPRYRELVWPNLKFDTIEVLLQQARTWEGDFVRILAGEWVERGAARDVVEKLRKESNARFFKVIPQPRVAEVSAEAALHAGQSPEDLLRGYVAARPCEVDDPALVLRAGLKLYEGKA